MTNAIECAVRRMITNTYRKPKQQGSSACSRESWATKSCSSLTFIPTSIQLTGTSIDFALLSDISQRAWTNKTIRCQICIRAIATILTWVPHIACLREIIRMLDDRCRLRECRRRKGGGALFRKSGWNIHGRCLFWTMKSMAHPSIITKSYPCEHTYSGCWDQNRRCHSRVRSCFDFVIIYRKLSSCCLARTTGEKSCNSTLLLPQHIAHYTSPLPLTKILVLPSRSHNFSKLLGY